MNARVKTALTTLFTAGCLVVLYFAYVSSNTAATSEAIAKKLVATENTTKSSAYYGAKRAEIALQEYNKGVVESVRGCNCGSEIDKYNDGAPNQWCTTFASWVTKEAGSPIINPSTKSWKIVNSRDFAEYMQANGTFIPKQQMLDEGIEPRVGDFIIYYRGDFEDRQGHVDIVVSDSKDGKADLIGGNIRDRIVYHKNFPYLDYYGFSGIARPEKD